MPKRKRIPDPRNTYLDNIQNWNQLQRNVVVSSIQGLAHVADFGDEECLRGCLEIKCLKTRALTIAVFWFFVKTPMFSGKQHLSKDENPLIFSV